MKNTKFTPGPWKVDGSGMAVYTETAVNAAGFCPYVAGTGMADVDLATARANARLIAAAPDLLAALEYWFDSNADPKKLAEMARSAIAKAKGE